MVYQALNHLVLMFNTFWIINELALKKIKMATPHDNESE